MVHLTGQDDQWAIGRSDQGRVLFRLRHGSQAPCKRFFLVLWPSVSESWSRGESFSSSAMLVWWNVDMWEYQVVICMFNTLLLVA